MRNITRRGFLKTSAVGTGAGVLAAVGPGLHVLAQSSGSSITSEFNGTAIPAGDTIWFNSVVKVHGLHSDPVTIGFTGSVSFTVDDTPYFISVPSAIVTFAPDVQVATTTYCNGTWITNVPLSHLAGNVFLDGFALQAPFPDGFPGGIKNITWQGTFYSVTPGLTVQWQWAAAVYTNFTFDYNALGVKPVDDNSASAYQNSDHAGTPENYRPYVTGGARGGGGSNYTGSYSGTGSTVPTLGNLVGNCGGSS